jgi:hypothetical protein
LPRACLEHHYGRHNTVAHLEPHTRFLSPNRRSRTNTGTSLPSTSALHRLANAGRHPKDWTLIARASSMEPCRRMLSKSSSRRGEPIGRAGYKKIRTVRLSTSWPSLLAPRASSQTYVTTLDACVMRNMSLTRLLSHITMYPSSTRPSRPLLS